MDKKLKAKWVKALRGRKFKQGLCVLRDENTNQYCCLGVLCAIEKRDCDAEDYSWLNRVTGDYSVFVKMNDDDGKSFPEIADYIEKNL